MEDMFRLFSLAALWSSLGCMGMMLFLFGTDLVILDRHSVIWTALATVLIGWLVILRLFLIPQFKLGNIVKKVAGEHEREISEKIQLAVTNNDFVQLQALVAMYKTMKENKAAVFTVTSILRYVASFLAPLGAAMLQNEDVKSAIETALKAIFKIQ